ncbi:hypothetical protein Tco_0760756, partial [Tanacetum coccineum]
FLCWVGISRNYLLNKDTYPRFEYESGEGGDGLKCFEYEEPIVTVAKHRGSGGRDQEIASVGGHGNVEPIVPTMDNVVAKIEAPGPRRSKKKRVTCGSEGILAASHPPKRLRADC